MAEKSKSFESFKSFRNSLRRWFPGLFVLGKGLSLLYSSRSFLRTSGFVESVRQKRPVRADGSPVPWMNYAMIGLLEDRLKKDLTVFEYGSGSSTLFFAERVKSIVSIEHDRGWYDFIKDNMPRNVTLTWAEDSGDAYVHTIREPGSAFDVVIVDAQERVRCLIEAKDHLTERGVILLDDADREQYVPGIEHLEAAGFRKLPFVGIKPGGVRAYTTTVFYRDGNALNL